METSVKKVKIYCIVLSALALFDALSFYLACIGSEYDSVIDEIGEEADEVMGIILVFLGIIVGCVMLVKLFFAWMGMREIHAKNKGTGYITFAYVIFGLYVIESVLAFTKIPGGEVDWISLAEHLCCTWIMFDYARNCKKIRELR